MTSSEGGVGFGWCGRGGTGVGLIIVGFRATALAAVVAAPPAPS